MQIVGPLQLVKTLIYKDKLYSRAYKATTCYTVAVTWTRFAHLCPV